MSAAEEYAEIQKGAAAWLNDATPEQKKKIADTVQQVAAMAAAAGKALDSILKRHGKNILAGPVQLPDNTAQLLRAMVAEGEAAAAFMDTLASLQDNPTVAASPFVSSFAKRLHDELAQCYDPRDVLASHYAEREESEKKRQTRDAVNSRKDRKAAKEIQAFALALYRQGPFGGGVWRDTVTAARNIESKVNARAAELGWPRKKTSKSYLVVQRWIEKGLNSTP
ncbi:hypothetical protein ACQAYK_01145 [Acidithiobacillus sp. AC3]